MEHKTTAWIITGLLIFLGVSHELYAALEGSLYPVSDLAYQTVREASLYASVALVAYVSFKIPKCGSRVVNSHRAFRFYFASLDVVQEILWAVAGGTKSDAWEFEFAIMGVALALIFLQQKKIAI